MPGNQIEHGGNIYRLAEELKIPDRNVIDFSTSVNPLGVSKKIKAELRKHLKYLHRYPDPDMKRLRKRLAQYHGIDPETILCGNGSTELIYLIARALKPQRVLMPAPTFSEYERASRTAESREQRADIEYFLLKRESGFEINPDEFMNTMKGENIAFLCNPNNPTGRLLKKGDIKKIADAAYELNCYLVVDEAFIDFCPDESVIKEVESNPYLIVLRTMTNYYALSGLRIGYGIFHRSLTNRIREYKEPWTVSNLAQRAALVALKDKVYRKETYIFMQQEKRFFEKNFKRLGIAFFPSDANFYLVKISGAEEISRALRMKGILIRECSNFKGLDSTYLRIAVKSHKENALLIKKLTAILHPHSVPLPKG